MSPQTRVLHSLCTVNGQSMPGVLSMRAIRRTSQPGCHSPHPQHPSHNVGSDQGIGSRRMGRTLCATEGVLLEDVKKTAQTSTVTKVREPFTANRSGLCVDTTSSVVPSLSHSEYPFDPIEFNAIQLLLASRHTLSRPKRGRVWHVFPLFDFSPVGR